jgi:hypothetical protein
MSIGNVFQPAVRPDFSFVPGRPTNPPAPRAERYQDILQKKGDHLIEDIGLTRQEILGPEKAFWTEWLKIKQPWQL